MSKNSKAEVEPSITQKLKNVCRMEKERDTRKETIKNFTAGGVSAMIARFVGQPLDVTKVRFQVYPNKYTSIVQALCDMYKQEGCRGLWKGHAVAQVGGTMEGAIHFFLYEEIFHSLRNTPLESSPNAKCFLSGFMAGTLGVLPTAPFDMIKSRQIANFKTNQFVSALNIVKTSFEAEGVKGVYKGALAGMLLTGPLIGTRFMIYNRICDVALVITGSHVKGDLSASILLFAGSASGVLPNLIFYPIDIVKRRVQVHGFKGGVVSSCTKIMDCIVKTIKDDGIRGLYKGISPTLLRTMFTTAITFGGFDKIKAAFNRLDRATD